MIGEDDLDSESSLSIEVSRHVINLPRDPMRARLLGEERGEMRGEEKGISLADMIKTKEGEIGNKSEKRQ
jgi:hypothetical protein